MIAVGTSETSIEVSKSQRLAEDARPRWGMNPGMPGGSGVSSLEPMAAAFWPPGAKRSAMVLGVGSGTAGPSGCASAASRSVRLAGLTMMSDGLSMKPSYASQQQKSHDG
jgi:hypothetical protein